jgi:hypothetical protein
MFAQNLGDAWHSFLVSIEDEGSMILWLVQSSVNDPLTVVQYATLDSQELLQ